MCTPLAGLPRSGSASDPRGTSRTQDSPGDGVETSPGDGRVVHSAADDIQCSVA